MVESGGIWIQGGGELASGIAWRLVRCGYGVVIAETAEPLAVRRLVCFCEAVREGSMEVEGIVGHRRAVDEIAFEAGRLDVVVDPGGEGVRCLCPAAVVDARMTKNAPVALPSTGAVSLGIGPGFVCGRDVDFIVETHRNARMGAVISEGSAAANTGIPGAVGGRAASRLLRSPAAGRLVTTFRIGDLVRSGEVIGMVGGEALIAGLDGKLRGLIHPEVELKVGWKVGDIDPRGDAIDPARISDKSLAVAGGVLEALLVSGIIPDGRH